MNHNPYILLILLITAFLSSIIYMSLNHSGHAGISRLILRNTKNHDLLIKWQNKWDHLIDTFRIILTLLSSCFFIILISSNILMNYAEIILLYIVSLIIYVFLIWMVARIIAENYADRITLGIIHLASALTYILSPITTPLYFLSNIISNEFNKRSNINDHPSTEDEVINLIDENIDQELDIEEREIIRSVFEFGDTVVREVMTPRVDIIGIKSTATVNQGIHLARDEVHSRFPVYYDNMDDILGVIHIRDLLSTNTKEHENLITTIMKKVVFVPETMPLNDVLQLMKKNRSQLVLVVDEYGGTSGLATMEDVIEELVGEIEDEYDLDEKDLIKKNDGTILVRAKMPIDELNEELSSTFTHSDEYDSIGGLICSELGYIPKIGECITLGNYNIKIQNASLRQVKIIQMTPIINSSDE